MAEHGEWPERSPWIREAVGGVPRHWFAPDRLWHWDGSSYAPIDRRTDQEEWAALVYGGPYDPAVIQVCDGYPTSSLSCQSIVVDMLDSLKLEPGHHVLELGTGTGWNAALMAWRTGPWKVTSLEVDPQLAATAAGTLAAGSARVTVETGDGSASRRVRVPYDRVISTYAVERVPWTWIEQSRPGGRIVTPWGRLGHVALTVADDGQSATGWMQGLALFMPARDRAPAPAPDWDTVRGEASTQRERELAHGLEDFSTLQENPHLQFALRVALPEVLLTTDVRSGSMRLHDADSSWATLSPDNGRIIARQGGARHLADELEQAWDCWLTHGRPEVYDYGMTVEPDGQYIWVHDAVDGPRWPPRAPR